MAEQVNKRERIAGCVFRRIKWIEFIRFIPQEQYGIIRSPQPNAVWGARDIGV